MKFCCLILVFCFPQMSWGQLLDSHMANVCLSIEPYAEVEIKEGIELTALDQANTKVPSRYRGATSFVLHSNTDVELMVISLDFVGGNTSVIHSITLNKVKGRLLVPYSDIEHEVDVQMDVKVVRSDILKAGVYEGEINVIVMAAIESVGCL